METIMRGAPGSGSFQVFDARGGMLELIATDSGTSMRCVLDRDQVYALELTLLKWLAAHPKKEG